MHDSQAKPPRLTWVANAPDNGRRSAPSADAETNAALELDRPTLARRARNELIEYLAIAAYLAVCFGALLFYKATILESEGIGFAHLSLAIVKALILGKFVLILEKPQNWEREKVCSASLFLTS